jgi:hypothetical protein
LRTALGHTTNRAETLQAAYNSSEQELVELRAATLEACQAIEEGEAQAGSSLASRLRTLAGTFPGACVAHSTWVSRRPSAWCAPTMR